LKNLNGYLTSGGSIHFDKSAPAAKTVFTQKATVKTGPLWLSLEGTWGNIRNFSLSDGLIIYNMPETIRSMYGITAWIPISKFRFNLLVRVQQSYKEGTTFVYTDSTNYEETYYQFIGQNLLITFRWNL
jgi:hypothetical protein